MSPRKLSPRVQAAMDKMTTEDVIDFLYEVAGEVEEFMDQEWAESVRRTADMIGEVNQEQGVSLDTTFFD